MCCGYRFFVELAGNKGPTGPGLVGHPDANHHVGGEGPWAAKPDTLRSLDYQSVTGALTDDAAFPLRGRRHDVGHELASRGGEVDSEIQRDEIPLASLRTRHEASEVNERSRQAVELGDDERRRLA